MIFSAFARALGQLGDPRFRRVLFLGVGLAVGLLALFYALFATLVGWATPETVTIPWVGEITWVDDLLSWGSLILMIGLSVFLMVPVASAMTGIFLEDVAEAVEARHYPDLPAAGRIPFFEAAKDTLTFLGVLILANVAALILYLMLPPFAPLIFWAMNGFLLGREYFTVAAMRRVGRVRAAELRRRHLPTIWLAGTLMALPLTVPLVNLLVPILGAATFTHLYHGLTARRA
ncbi:Uncharacterized protein involved in cysteine biosynthesis [Roseivivax halotolerans]|uniref:Uncharacterized protein involved in cysteine biosynthesis n=1 Tax=Roseivivax halotolerans TaxID=93684 RepID=A0A1I5V4H9_9RHOB|nr:EI24 domain-containing protein [Roseivivax halotolerans]SFQ02423.1 Uncharacterized protein involved in cysteine biosynthesis [Roseivivax halotolerans]